MWSLWALGVGAVISGEYYGWNFGLGTGGFGGLLIAAVFMAIMYYGLVYSIAEMSPALPHTGGAYSFARSAMGPWGGFLTGLAENMEYVITPAVVVGAMGLLMQQIIGGPVQHHGQPLVEQPAVLVGGLLHHLRVDQHRRHRGHDALHGVHHGARPSPSSCSSSSPRSSPGSSTSRCGRTSRQAAR